MFALNLLRKENAPLDDMIRTVGRMAVLKELIQMVASNDSSQAVLACEYAARLGDKDIMDRAGAIVLCDPKASVELQERVCRALKLPAPSLQS